MIWAHQENIKDSNCALGLIIRSNYPTVQISDKFNVTDVQNACYTC